jgi:hypothetical protein
MLCKNKECVRSSFRVRLHGAIQILDNTPCTVYFLGDFNETLRLVFFSCPSTDVPSFVEKHPKIKYIIMATDLCV